MNLPYLKIGHLTAKVPIVQGGMGIGVSLSSLASAVANEGGIGIISGVQIGFKESDFSTNTKDANIRALKKEIKKAKELSPKGIIGVNILTAANEFDKLVETAAEENIDLIVCGAGLPTNLPGLVKNNLTKLVPIVSSGKAASVITKLWKKRYNYLPDAIVLEGPKAGGHLGFTKEDLLDTPKDLDTLLIDVLKVIKPYEEESGKKIPIIAGGGIYNGNDIAKFINLGASGIQMGTRFVPTVECDAHINFKKAYINAKKEDIDIIISPVGMPGRAITNEFIESVKGNKENITKCFSCLKSCNPKNAPYCITKALINSVNGNVENGLIFCGSNAYKSNKIITVKELFEELIEEIEKI